jgi:phthiocerol/phenolphthiocerol synthesis type-I polyketide synthase E
MNPSEKYDNNNIGIAIIGMAGRFPGADSIERFWDNLKNGVNAVRHFTDGELQGHVPPAALNHPDYVKSGYILNDIDRFDAGFFNIAPSEAASIDPQQRLFLECAWEALEDAGYVPEQSNNNIGVYASVSLSSYVFRFASDFSLSDPMKYFRILLGNDKDYLATRVSYKLNLNGPSFVSQSACSSSLTSISLACQGLLDYHCDMALAGGASVHVPQKVGHLYNEEEGLSRDGKVYAFDARACGITGGNGVAVVVLKRVAEALADGDNIYGVIRGFALNNDGSRKVGFMAPSVEGQSEVISEALAMADVDPDTVGYVEAHGTGTLIGDPIEIKALSRAYGTRSPKHEACAVGSVKTNVGHLDAAAGATALIKTALTLKHRLIPPSLNYETPNPEIAFDNSPFYINTELKPWVKNSTPLRAGVSSFGLGGTNIHMVLEEAPEMERPAYERDWHLLTLSGKRAAALNVSSQRLAAYLQNNPQTQLSDVAYTLQTGRKAFAHRKILVCRDREDAIALLKRGDAKRVMISDSPVRSGTKSIAFMFPGVGSQHDNMGWGLYESETVYRDVVDRCADYLKSKVPFDVREVLYPETFGHQGAPQSLLDPSRILPAIFVTEYALASLWRSWGIEPAAMIGHSLGENVAAALAGVFSWEDALSLVAKRGELMREIPKGGMMTVLAPERGIEALMSDQLSIGAVNGPSLCMVSGPTEAVDALQKTLKTKKIGYRRLPAERAGHSSMTEPILERFREAVSAIELKPPRIPILSNVSGTWMTDQEATDPNHWTRHIRETVRFAAGLKTLLKNPDTILLEMGPGRGLSTLAKRHPAATPEHSILSCMRDPRQSEADGAVVTGALGSLWLAGFDMDWTKAIYPSEKCRRVSLPTYPFERQRHWTPERNSRGEDTAPENKTGEGVSFLNELMNKQSDVDKWFSVPAWKRKKPLHRLDMEKAAGDDRPWLIFSDTHGIGSGMIGRLREAGRQVISVDVGEPFARMDAYCFRIDPRRQEDYNALMAALVEARTIPGIIAHLWSVTAKMPSRNEIEFREASQTNGYQSLIHIVRALSSLGLDELPLQWGIISNHLYAVTGNERLSPEKSTILGPARVIPTEFSNMECVSIDIEAGRPDAEMVATPEIIDTLISDIAGYPDIDMKPSVTANTVAYRGKYRWEHNIDPISLAHPEKADIPFRRGGVYLITGGLGGVPFLLARYLVRQWGAKLVLTGRTRLPAKSEWETWLAENDQTDGVSERIRKIAELEDLGGEVMVISADVGNLDDMRMAWDRATEHFGAINGVFHAASMATSSMMLIQTPERSATVMGPKVQGTLVLDQLCRDADDLDFLMLFSSISSYLGSLGHADYTAANIFLDVYANAMDGVLKHRVVSVNWGYWHGVGIGLKLIPKLAEFLGDNAVIQGILPEEGIECLERTLSTHLPQVIVSSSSFPVLLHRFFETTKTSMAAYKALRTSGDARSRPKLGVAYVAPGNAVEQTIADIWQELLGIDAIGVNDSFLELGGDSLLAMPLINRLRETFRSKLPLRAVFSQDTIAKLAVFIVDSEEQEGKTVKIAQTIQRVKQMSPEQVAAALKTKQMKEEVSL